MRYRRRAFEDFFWLSIATWLLLAFSPTARAKGIPKRENISIAHTSEINYANWRVDSTRPALSYEPEIASASELYLKEILKQLIAINKKLDRAMIRMIGSTVKGVDKYENIGKIPYSNFTRANCESLMNTDAPSGVYNFPSDQSLESDARWLWNVFEIYCDQSYGGGWTVVQRRDDKLTYRVNFTNKTSDDYAKGFGNLNGEFWLGSEWIHRMTSHFGPYELRLEFEDSLGNRSIKAEYAEFTVGSRDENYRIKIGAFAGKNNSVASNDSTVFGNNGSSDLVNLEHDCIMDFHGTWWFPDNCIGANLNSDDYKNTKMMIRSRKHRITSVANTTVEE